MPRPKIKTKKYFCFASEFEAARRMAGYSLPQVAAICCRDVKTVTNWEAGRKPCPSWALRLITLESRYMHALYGLQQPNHARQIRITAAMTYAANDPKICNNLELRLILSDP